MRETLSAIPPLATTTLISLEGDRGILRCTHRQQAAVVEALRRLDRAGSRSVRMVPVGVSGTLKAARRKYGSQKGS